MTGIGTVLARRRARSIFRGARRHRIGAAARLGAVMAAGYLILVSAPLAPVSAAVTCDAAWTRGTLDANGNWRAGAGDDYRVRCTGDTDGDTVTGNDFPDIPAGADKLVIDVSDANVDRATDSIPDAEGGHLVLTGSLASAAGNNVSIVITAFAGGQEAAHSVLESFATIAASGRGSDGIQFTNEDANHTGTIEAINRGTITTTGEWFAYGLDVRSHSSSARGENAGSITTSGDAGRGVYAAVNNGAGGTSTATNRGTIRTTGGVRVTQDNMFYIPSDGVRAVHNADGDAEASNAAGGTVAIAGIGGRGVSSYADGDGDAVATNAGSVVTRGDAFVNPGNTSWIGPYGVLAVSGGGDATARNSASGSVETHGVPGYGVIAISRGSGDARVENAGTVATHATASIDTLPNTSGLEIGARGLYASSRSGDFDRGEREDRFRCDQGRACLRRARLDQQRRQRRFRDGHDPQPGPGRDRGRQRRRRDRPRHPRRN